MDAFWFIPLFPLLGFLITGPAGSRIPRPWAGILASLAVFVSFSLSLWAFFHLAGGGQVLATRLFTWIPTEAYLIAFSLRIDALTSLMLLVVTGVGFLIHVYSIGYMHDDEGFNRFFTYLNLFMFSMILLVMAGNFLVMFIGWEGVGLCSYLLIGFWYKDHANNDAANKAFIMNRIGDLGFLLAIFLILFEFGTLEFVEVMEMASSGTQGGALLTTITLLLFVGATGKSAQIPLFTWLPDAMAGPTPVSALIHAATMVTAGVYMVARCQVLFVLSPLTMEVIAFTGLATALIAAAIALFQNDIKKILAYSTISQLGFMFLALGAGAFTGAVFHLTTHAFFKALLFLAAGSIIHALSGEQDIRKMGGLSSKMRVSFLCFLIATLAISGIPPFAGFFSKDEILLGVFGHSPVLWAGALGGAMLTAFYMFRLFFIVFSGTFRGNPETYHHAHESPPVMAIPLVLLALLALGGGFIGLPQLFGGTHQLSQFLSPVLATDRLPAHAISESTEWVLLGITLALTILAILTAKSKFAGKQTKVATDSQPLPFLRNLVVHKFFVDELYDHLVVKPLNWSSAFLHQVVELKGIDALVNGIGNLVTRAGNQLRLVQTGNTGFYLFMMVFGIILILFLNLLT